MYGLKALQADGLLQQRQEVKPAMVQMRNSVDTYYRNVLPTTKTSSSYSTYNVQEPAPIEGQAHGGACPQEDGKHLLQHIHGCPLTPCAKLASVFLSLLTSSVKKLLLYRNFLLSSLSLEIHEVAKKILLKLDISVPSLFDCVHTAEMKI